MKFEKLKLEQKLNYEKQIEEGRKLQSKESTAISAKLPKLVITKFKGTHADWPRFWGQFEAEIDKSGVPQATKFSYLKELVDPKVRLLIDGLPFSTEGYHGKESEIINAHVNNIALPTLHGSNPNKISEFYEKLLLSVQALETMGKLTEVNGYVRLTLDKLEGSRGDLVRTDDDWRDWKFPQLVEALQKWTERNPSKPEERITEKSQLPSARPANKSMSFQAKQTGANHATPKPCVYCDSVNHKPSNCDKVISVSDRRECLAKKQLCYNCTDTNHEAAQCRCTITCQVCNRRHHTSICDKPREQILVATKKRSVIYPVVIVEVEGIKCRALLDTGAGSSYASAALLDRLHKRAVRKEFRRIEMMMQATSKEIEVHNLTTRNTAGDFTLNVEVTKIDRGVLLSLDNPKYESLTTHYSHLQGVEMEDNDKKAQLPVHLILGASEYTQIKTRTSPKIGNPGEPIAELTQLGWTIMSPGKEVDLANMLLT